MRPDDFQAQTEYLLAYIAVTRKIDSQFDVRGSDLGALVDICLDAGGVLPLSRREQFAGSVPAPVFDAIERQVCAALAARNLRREEARGASAECTPGGDAPNG